MVSCVTMWCEGKWVLPAHRGWRPVKSSKYPRSLEAYPSGDLVSPRQPRLDEAVKGPEAILRKLSPHIESVQRYYTKCIIGMRGKSYKERLYSLGLPSLVYRRLRGDLIETYKITHKIYDPNITNSLINLAHTNTRSHNFKLSKPRVNTNKFLNFFTNRIINVWNNLPGNIVEASSLNCFKNKTDKYFKDYMYEVNFDVSEVQRKFSEAS